MSKALSLIRLLRPINCLMMGLAVLIGETIAYKTLYLYPSILGFITAFTITAASMVLNDYWDRSVDAINAPNRPIASGLVSVRLAFLYAFLLISIGLCSAFLTSPPSLLIALSSLLISLIYSYKVKKLGLIGNFMVGSCIAIPLIYGGFLYVNYDLSFNGFTVLLVFDLMIFLAVTGREVNKGLVDVEGDKAEGIMTVAVRSGLKKASLVAVALYLSAVVLSIIPSYLRLTSWLYLPIVFVADIGFIFSSIKLVYDTSKRNALKVKNMVLIWMSIGLLAFLIGVLR